MSRSKPAESSGVVPLLEEVIQTAKSLPMSAWALYYGATVPFVMAFLYFWGDMANNAFAYGRAALWSLVLAGLFAIAKTGHALFTHAVESSVTDNPGRPSPRLGGLLLNQTALQATGLLILPLTLFVVAPFGLAYATYQNMTVLDDGRRSLRELVAEARRHAGLNAKQCHLAIWLTCPYVVGLAAAFFLVIMPLMQLTSPAWTDYMMTLYSIVVTLTLIPLCPFGMVVALNIGVGLITVPQLLKSIFGVETAFTIAGGGATSPTFFVIVVGMTYLCLDPLVKIAFTLRCFYGNAIQTGGDLRVKLAKISGGLIVLAAIGLGIAAPQTAFAQDASVSIANLDSAIEETLQNPRFTWREPRQRPEAIQPDWVKSMLQAIEDAGRWIGDRISDFVDWLRDLFSWNRNSSRGTSGFQPDILRMSAMVLVIAMVCALVYLAWRTWSRQTVVEVSPVAARGEVPDLEDEQIRADLLASQEWLDLAAELMEKGETRLAMRAFFLAGLARLGQLRLIRIAAYKSNREYSRELQRVAHAREGIVDRFRDSLNKFESVWYGDHTLTQDDFQQYVKTQRWMSNYE